MTSRDEKGDKYGRQVWETRNRKNIQVKGTRIRDKKLGAKQRSSRHLGSIVPLLTYRLLQLQSPLPVTKFEWILFLSMSLVGNAVMTIIVLTSLKQTFPEAGALCKAGSTCLAQFCHTVSLLFRVLDFQNYSCALGILMHITYRQLGYTNYMCV